MKNADMPAMPLTGNIYEDFSHPDYEKGNYTIDGIGLTKREMFAMNAPEMDGRFIEEFLDKYNKVGIESDYISKDYPILSVKGYLAATKEWRYLYADMMLED